MPTSGTGAGHGPSPPAGDAWIARYEQTASAWAACAFVETLGAGQIDINVRPVLDWHDELSRATCALPLG